MKHIFYNQVNLLPDNETISWKKIIKEEITSNKEKYDELDRRITEAYLNGSVNPAKENLLKAFKLCPFDKYKVCICGQDPYPNKTQAMGLAFSIPEGATIPASLRNILTELKDDIGGTKIENGDLTSWAEQGVLLINTALTVEEGKPGSHKDIWGDFVMNVLIRSNKMKEGPIVYVLWGSHSKKIGERLEEDVVSHPRRFMYSVHPSPLSSYRGFFGSKPFSKVNEFLRENEEKTIEW